MQVIRRVALPGQDTKVNQCYRIKKQCPESAEDFSGSEEKAAVPCFFILLFERQVQVILLSIHQV